MCLLRWKAQSSTSPKLNLLRTRRQDDAITSLYTFMCDSDPRDTSLVDDSYTQKLDCLLLELLESLQYQKLDHTRYITCILDVVMILLSLNPDGSFRKASETTHHCALLQYMMRTTAVHTLRLHSLGEEEYVPFSPTEASSDDGIIEEPDGTFLS